MKTYGAAEVSVVIGGVPMTGLMDGEAVTVARNTPSAVIHKGFAGESAVVFNSDKSGVITLRFQQTSLSNAVLSSFEATKAIVPAIIKDTNGNSLHSGAKCVIGTMPTSGYAQELSAREWTILVADLIHFEGGSPDA